MNTFRVPKTTSRLIVGGRHPRNQIKKSRFLTFENWKIRNTASFRPSFVCFLLIDPDSPGWSRLFSDHFFRKRCAVQVELHVCSSIPSALGDKWKQRAKSCFKRRHWASANAANLHLTIHQAHGIGKVKQKNRVREIKRGVQLEGEQSRDAQQGSWPLVSLWRVVSRHSVVEEILLTVASRHASGGPCEL